MSIKSRQSTFKTMLKIISCILACSLVLFFLVPLLINKVFSSPARSSFFAVNWEAADTLIFYGSVLSAIAAIVVGYFAVTSAQRSNALSEKLLEYEQKTKLPILSVISMIGMEKKRDDSSISKYIDGVMDSLKKSKSNICMDATIDRKLDENGAFNFSWVAPIAFNPLDGQKGIYLRLYEIKLKHIAGVAISVFRIKKIELNNKPFDLNTEIQAAFSLGTEQTIKLLFLSNEDFLLKGSDNSIFCPPQILRINLILESSSGEKYDARFMIHKVYCNDADIKCVHQQTERFVSYTYDVEYMQNDVGE